MQKDLLVSHVKEIKTKYHKYLNEIKSNASQNDSAAILKINSTMLFGSIPNDFEIPESAKVDKKFFRSRVRLQQITDDEPKRRTSHRFQILPCNITFIHDNPYQPKGILLKKRSAKKKSVQWSDTLVTYINPQEETDSGEDTPKRKKMKPDNEAHPNKLSPQKKSDEPHPMILKLREKSLHNSKSYQEYSSDDEMSCDSSDENVKVKTKTKGALRSLSLRKPPSTQADILKNEFGSRYFQAKILLQPITDDRSNSLIDRTLDKSSASEKKKIPKKTENKEDKEIEGIFSDKNESPHCETSTIFSSQNEMVDETPLKCSTPCSVALSGLQKHAKVTINNSIKKDLFAADTSRCETPPSLSPHNDRVDETPIKCRTPGCITLPENGNSFSCNSPFVDSE